MKKYNFDCLVNREGSGSLKGFYTPDYLSKAGLPGYWGAEFDFPTCPLFSEGVIECARRGLYAFTLQTDEYNQHVSWWMENVRHWQIKNDWIIPTHGTIFALATAIRLFVGEGQHMLMITPGYSRYKQAADRIGKKTIFCPMSYISSENRYEIDYNRLENCMSNPGCALLVICNPNNPTGLVLDENELRKIDDLSEKFGIPVFSDEIFAEISLSGDVIVPYGKAVRSGSYSITCTSLGKCMSLTGVNHANVIISDPDLRDRYIKQKYADHYGSIDPMLYAGLLKAYTQEGKDWLDDLLEIIRSNRSDFCSGIEASFPGAKVVPADGTYVAWVDFTRTRLSEQALAKRLNEAMLLGDPGSEYFADDLFYRYSIAVPPSMLRKSMKHLLQVYSDILEKTDNGN